MISKSHKYGYIALCGILIIAIGYRFYLWDVFFGWEESDYGNIAMVQGVKESNFTHYDMNHMPGYYGLAALLLFVVDDSIFASKLAATLGGSASLLLLAWLMKQFSHLGAAIILTLCLSIQPEFSLYASSALREPVYTFFLVLML